MTAHCVQRQGGHVEVAGDADLCVYVHGTDINRDPSAEAGRAFDLPVLPVLVDHTSPPSSCAVFYQEHC